jgi:hypothetical protein
VQDIIPLIVTAGLLCDNDNPQKETMQNSLLEELFSLVKKPDEDQRWA